MLYEVDGTTSDLGRCVSAELRARMAALRVSGKTLASKAGMSQNYLAKRLRDEAPFTLDDIDSLIHWLLDDMVDPGTFITQAYDRNHEEVWAATEELEKRNREAKKSRGGGDPRVDVSHGEDARIYVAFDKATTDISTQAVVDAGFLPRAARRRTTHPEPTPDLDAQAQAGEENQELP